MVVVSVRHAPPQSQSKNSILCAIRAIKVFAPLLKDIGHDGISLAITRDGPRSGSARRLAKHCPHPAPAQKLQWIQGAYDAGIREIEVGSFVPPKLLPQLADTAELVAFAKT
jgi:hypothetical protein